MSEKKIKVELTEAEATRVSACIRLAICEDEQYLLTHEIDNEEAHEKARRVQYYLNLADRIEGKPENKNIIQCRRY